MPHSLRFVILALLLAAARAVGAQSTPPSWRQAQALVSSGAVGFSGLALDAQGNAYVTGTFSSPLTLSPGTVLTPRGGTDGYLAKYTAAGALAWVVQAGGTSGDRLAGVALDATGTVYVVGDFSNNLQMGTASMSTSNAGQHLFFAVVTPQGQVASLEDDGAPAGPTGGSCSAAGIGLDASGNVYVTGMMSGGPLSFGGMPLTGSLTARDYFVIKYPATGVANTAAWARQGGRTANVPGQVTYTPTLVVAPAGDTYLVGTFAAGAGAFGNLPVSPEHGGFDVGVVKYGPQGAEQWARRSGGAGFDRARYATVDATGRLAVAAEFQTAATFGGQPLAGTGTRSGALLVYATASGAEQWARVLTGSTQAYYGGVAADAAGNFYAVGTFDGTGAAGGASLTSGGGTDAAVVSYSPQGAFRWQQQSNGPDNEMAFAVRLDNAQHLRVGGSFVGTAQFGPGLVLAGQGTNPNVFLAQTAAVPLASRGARHALALALFPNPAHAAVGLASLPVGTRVTITDALGRAVYSTATAGGTLPLAGLVPGSYLVRATAADGRQWINRLQVE